MATSATKQVNAIDHAHHYSEKALAMRRWFVLIGLVTAAVMEVLDTSIVNVAIPQISGNLGATLDEIGWVATGYIISNVIVLPMTSWLSSLFGRKRYLTGSIILFIIASVLCGTSHSLGELIFWRVVQGAGGAALLSTAQATLFEIFPREQQGLVQALFGLGIVMAPTLGPTLGGIITDNYNWRWIFFINVPIGTISAILVMMFIDDSKYARKRSSYVDWAGIGFLALGLGCLQTVLEKGERDDWFQASWVVWCSAISIVTLTAFVFWQLNKKNTHPIVDLHILRTKSYAAGLPLAFALGMGLYGGVFIFPVFAQNLLHFTAQQTGMVLLPGGIATAVSMIGCGKFVRKVDPRLMLIVGFSIFIWSMFDLSNMTLQSGQQDTFLALMVRGFGLGFIFLPLTIVSVQTLPKSDIAQGAALFNLFRQLGGSFGIALLNTLIQNHINTYRAHFVQYANSANTLFTVREHALTGAFNHMGFDPVTAMNMANSVIDHQVQGQASNLAFADAFRFMACIFICVIPLLALLKRPKFAPADGGPPTH